MPEQAIPDSVQNFLSSYIRSMEQLEVLLLLGRSPERSWTAQEVYAEVLSNLSSISNRLEKFVADGLIENNGGQPPQFRFAPKKPELRPIVQEVAAFYRDYPLRVMRTIYPPRVDPAQSFADAFKLKRD